MSNKSAGKEHCCEDPLSGTKIRQLIQRSGVSEMTISGT